MYKVELKKNFIGTRRNRAGLSFAKGEVYELDLNKDQLIALKADAEFVVSRVEEQAETKPPVDESAAKSRKKCAKKSNGEQLVGDNKQMVDNQEEKQA